MHSIEKVIIAICLLLFGCSSNHSKNNSDIKANFEFKEIYQKLPVIQLPLKIQTTGENGFVPEINPTSDETLKSRFGFNGYASVYGRLFENDKFCSILIYLPTDVGTPVIMTYDNKGVKLDSIALFDDRPADMMGLVSRESVVISKDGLVHFTDSSTYLDTNDKPLKSEINKKIISIDSTGHFRINKE
jgi:hypothetical protein